MIRPLQHGALILAFLGVALVQKVHWVVPLEPPLQKGSQCTEIVLPPLPLRQGWLVKRVQPITQPVSPLGGAEADLYLVTGYAIGDGYTPGYITADGRKVRPGITVACPVELALGTAVYIKGFGVRICEDRGIAIIGKRLDVAFETPETAMLFGRQRLAVVVIR